MSFNLFDPDQDTTVQYGRLPHWYQPGITYFITFRTADSVPKAVMDDWQGRRRAWLRERELPEAATAADLPAAVRREYHRVFSAEFLGYLDHGYGECVLKRPELAKIVLDALLHFDGDRYDVAEAVVMPNHVHALVGLLGATDLQSQCKSWKHYTAVRINRRLSWRGEFWQVESFDHAVRTPEAFGRFRWYIAENPHRAGLREGEYLRYSKPIASRSDAAT
jgi:REP element-mobilizing transposase RayT